MTDLGPRHHANGLRFHYQQSGEGPDIMLVHGVTGDLSIWFLCRAIQTLSTRYRVTAFDLRGHGRSGGGRGRLDAYEHLLDDAELAWSHFHEEGLPAFLYGHSLGGQIALHFARRRESEIRGVVIASPWLRLSMKPKLWKLWLARAG